MNNMNTTVMNSTFLNINVIKMMYKMVEIIGSYINMVLTLHFPYCSKHTLQSYKDHHYVYMFGPPGQYFRISYKSLCNEVYMRYYNVHYCTVYDIYSKFNEYCFRYDIIASALMITLYFFAFKNNYKYSVIFLIIHILHYFYLTCNYSKSLASL